MKNKIKLLFVFFTIAFFSCLSPRFYNFSLTEVEKNTNSGEQNYKFEITKFPDTVVTKYIIKDSLFDFVFYITEYQFEFDMTNKSNKDIKILWEKSAYINPKGERKRVIHKGISYSQKAVVQMPTIVPKNSKISEILLPSDNISVYLYGNGGWTIYPLFTSKDIGKNACAILAIEINGTLYEYVFKVKIASV